IYTASHEERHVFQAIQRGAIGYLTKDTDAEALLHAIHCAARNDLCIPGPLATPMIAQIRAIWRTHGYFVSRRGTSAFAYRTPRRIMTRPVRPTPVPVTPVEVSLEIPEDARAESEETTEQPVEGMEEEEAPVEAVGSTPPVAGGIPP